MNDCVVLYVSRLEQTSLNTQTVNQSFYYFLFTNNECLTCHMQNFNILASLCSQAGWVELMCRSRGRDRGSWPSPSPLKNSKAIEFLSNTGQDPLENHKASNQCWAIISLPVKGHLNWGLLAGRWLPVFSGTWILSPHQLKEKKTLKNVVDGQLKSQTMMHWNLFEYACKNILVEL